MRHLNGETGRQGKEEWNGVRLRVTWVSLGGAEMVWNYIERTAAWFFGYSKVDFRVNKLYYNKVTMRENVCKSTQPVS